MYTYQDFIKEPTIIGAIQTAIQKHTHSDFYKIAKDADEYDHQRNITILNYVKIIFNMYGTPIEDFTASNNKICSNFFHRLNTQRCTYLLGNGVSFTDNKTEQKQDGVKITVDQTKETLGDQFDTDLKNLAYDALIHGVAFGFWNVDRLHVFPVTEFVPLWDEDDGSLRAGVRFWQIDKNKPMIAVLYEEDGYTKYKSKNGGNSMEFEEIQPKRAYKLTVQSSQVDGEEIIGESNYGTLPIVPLWGSRLKQSTLVGMRCKIDSFDLIRSGFANDLTDCSQIYWILENCGGMNDAELARFRDRLKIQHIAAVDTDNSSATPYTQDVPYNARKEYLDEIKSGIYEDFGGLDVHTIAAGATNDHIDAAYQPMDEEADDFEYQVTEFVQQVLALMGIEDTPVFKRNRISNEKERTEMILSAAQYLDDETILQKLPFVTVDEVANILMKKDEESESRFVNENVNPEENEDTQNNNPFGGQQEQEINE